MLAAQRDAGLAVARDDDVADEAGQRRRAADEEGGESAPVGGEPRRVAVDAVEIVHGRYGNPAAADDVVAVEFG